MPLRVPRRVARSTRPYALALASLLAAPLLTGCPRTITPAEIEQHGTRPYPTKSRAQVVKASAAALQTLGFEVVVVDEQHGWVKTAPKVMQTHAVGNAYGATAIQDSLAWTLEIDAAGSGALVHAHPRAYRNGQSLDERNMLAAYMERAFNDLFREIDSNLSGHYLAAPQK
ncbi:MAG: hypothetical protein NVSMB47_13570 [Polyangiales bacterium]